MMLPRILLLALSSALLFGGALGAYTDKVKEAAKSEAELKADGQSHAADSSAKPRDDEQTKPETARVAVDRWTGLVMGLTLFVLALFVGFEVIAKIPPALHTPLMSGATAISGVTLVGASITAGFGLGFSSFLGMVAVVLATINVVAGFLVTQRLLSTLHRKE